MIELGPMRPGGHPAARPTASQSFTERHVLAIALALAGAFVVAALLAAIRGIVAGGGAWTGLHLALAGAATVAIGAFMPHFAVTLAGTMPAPSGQRFATIAALGTGALAVVGGVDGRVPGVTTVGALLMLAGLGGVAVQTVSPSRQPLARRHPAVTVTYVVALLELAAGIVIGTLGATGLDPVLSAWARLRPTHAWITLFGAISLTIVATLVYLGPTVVGARIRVGWGLPLAIGGVGIGPILAAIGFATDARLIAMAGAAGTGIGGIGQIAYLVDAYRRRGRFTSEHDWRLVATAHLLIGPAWLSAAATVALVDLAAGRSLAGWSLGLLALPMVGGWMLQELVGSWTHLAPSVTPGHPDRHARQRRVLAVASRTRLVAWNAGLAMAWLGLGAGLPWLAVAGGVAVVAAVLTSVALLGRALALR